MLLVIWTFRVLGVLRLPLYSQKYLFDISQDIQSGYMSSLDL